MATTGNCAPLYTVFGNLDTNYPCYYFDEAAVPNILLKYGFPIFLSGVFLEWLYADIFCKYGLFRLNDTFNSMAHGLCSQFMDRFLKVIGVGVPYVWIFKNFGIHRFAMDNWWSWPLVFLGVDLGYYWFHRFSHEINTWWLGHATHHSSEEYNLSTALRQSGFSGAFSWSCYLWLAPFFPPEVFFIHSQLNTMYQFFIHTELVGNMGFLEIFLNTPSHHRVHHGRNPKYLDKNYGGILIIWDRIFGTFEPEIEQPVYGLVTPLTTWSILWGQTHHLHSIVSTFWKTEGIFNKFSTFW
jgi:alkylglycerol monooxygenase